MNLMNTTVNSMYLSETAKLVSALEAEKISFEICYMAQGFMVVFPSLMERDGDVALHYGTYGNAHGLFEGYMGMSYNEDDVCVFDSIEDVVEMAKKYKKD